MRVAIHVDEDRVTLGLNGRFDFHCFREFRQAVETVLGDSVVRELVLDLSRVEYVDSSALGMLLLMKEQADASNKKVQVCGAGDSVRKALEVANFQKLFQMV
jgi:HptB-dependent secretion and biofilm anti anti-sigma factor